MRRFEKCRPPQPCEVSVSIKVRVQSGCFHREHSPHAYALIDQRLMSFSSEPAFQFEEHESGPALLVYAAVATAVVTLAKSVIDLVAAIIKARSEGIARGDGPSCPVELIVRRTDKEFLEEVVLRVGPGDLVSQKVVGKCLSEAVERVIGTEAETQRPGPQPPSQGDRRRSGPRRS